MDNAIKEHVHGKNIVYGINATDKLYLKEKMKLIGTLSSNNTEKIGMIPSASKDVLVKFSDQFIHMINNK